LTAPLPYSYSSPSPAAHVFPAAPVSLAPSLIIPLVVPGSGAVGLRRCFTEPELGGDTLGPGGDTLPTLTPEGETLLFVGDTLPTLPFALRWVVDGRGGDNLSSLEFDRGMLGGDALPSLAFGGDTPPVREVGMSMTVGEPRGAGTDRRVSESRRLWPYVGRCMWTGGGGGGWYC
jgi:hypothetical protein